MKKYLVLAAGFCMVTAALAADYNLRGDWVWGGSSNPNGAWGYGMRAETAPGVFDPFAAHTTGNLDGVVPGWDHWSGAAPNSTCAVFATDTWNGWSFPAPNVILNAWEEYASAVHWAGDAGTYNLSATFMTGGYVTPTDDFPDVRIYVTKNGSDVLLATELFGFSGVTAGNNGATLNGEITIAPGDYLDFFIAGGPGVPEVRSSLAASLTPVPEPTILAFFGLAGLFLLRRRA